MNNIKPDSGLRLHDSPDELAGLLRRFFQAEMPHPWPELKAPAASSGRQRLWLHYRSKLALAAAITLLLLGSWWLAGRTADYTIPVVQPSGPSGIAEKVSPAEPTRQPEKP